MTGSTTNPNNQNNNGEKSSSVKNKILEELEQIKKQSIEIERKLDEERKKTVKLIKAKVNLRRAKTCYTCKHFIPDDDIECISIYGYCGNPALRDMDIGRVGIENVCDLYEPQ